MTEAGFITTAQHDEAVVEPLSFRRPGSEPTAPYFLEYVRQLLIAKYGETMVYKGGLHITTTLNFYMQRAAEAAFKAGLREVDKRQGWRGPLRTVDPASLTAGNTPVVTTDQPLAVGDEREAVVTKVGKDLFWVQSRQAPAQVYF